MVKNRKHKSLLIAAQNNTTMTIYLKAKIDNTQQKSKINLCSDREEMNNCIMSKCSKLVEKDTKVDMEYLLNEEMQQAGRKGYKGRHGIIA